MVVVKGSGNTPPSTGAYSRKIELASSTVKPVPFMASCSLVIVSYVEETSFRTFFSWVKPTLRHTQMLSL